jgi:protein-S-isoprenylcysteine O-methyltransferase Ste14
MRNHVEVKDPAAKRVRPRLVWSGTGLMIVGVIGVGVGLMIRTSSTDAGRWVIGAGFLALLVGLLVAWWGGIGQDTKGSSEDHGHEVVSGQAHTGISSQAKIVGPSVQRRAELDARRTLSLERQALTTSVPTLRFPGAVVLMVIGAWLCLDQWLIDYPFSVSGQNAVLRDVGLGVVLVLSGLRLQRARGSRRVSVIVLLAGALLVLIALFFANGSSLVRGNEFVAGVLTLVAAAMTLF